MVIRTLETFTQGYITLVRATDGSGAEGWGQCAPYNADLTAAVFHRQVGPRALGREVGDIGSFVEDIIDAEYKFRGSYVCRAAAGLETALWDLAAKARGISVCELLGGIPGPVPAYGSSMRRDIKPEEEAARLRELKGTHGYRAFKVRIGKVLGRDADEWPGRTAALVPAVRAAVGRETRILVDGNSGFTVDGAIRTGRWLEGLGVVHFEEPCPFWELEETARVAKALGMDVAGGEQDTEPAQFRRMVAMRAVEVVQPDVCYLGGISRTVRVAGFAAEEGLACTPHSANRSLVTVFTMHVLKSIPNAGAFMEFSIEPDNWADEIFTPVLEAKDGAVPFPAGPGWGVKIRESWLAAAKREESSRR